VRSIATGVRSIALSHIDFQKTIQTKKNSQTLSKSFKKNEQKHKNKLKTELKLKKLNTSRKIKLI
jgi:translation initiation factor 2B subunit (eIF-2B alpha/beta/delta family)